MNTRCSSDSSGHSNQTEKKKQEEKHESFNIWEWLEKEGRQREDLFSKSLRSDLWDWLKHEENLFTTRLGLFLTFEGILASAVGVVFTIKDPPWQVIFGLSGFALVIGIFWLFENRAGYWNIQPLLDQLNLPESPETLFHWLVDIMHKKRLFKLERNNCLSIVLPLFVISAWIALVIMYAIFLSQQPIKILS